MLVSHHPAPLGGLVIEVEFVAGFPQMLPGMIEIYDFDGAGELLRDDVPDPIGTVAHHHFLLRPAPATLMSFGVGDRKSTRLNSSHANISYADLCLKKKKKQK